ncbi:hypothetical protein AB0E04_38775 [Streptomyces sp. NPDC048251]
MSRALQASLLELDHPNPFGVTVVLMEEDGYKVRLAETFAR